MNKYIENDKVYLLTPPKHSFLAIVAVDTPIFPLPTAITYALEKVKECGFDLFFVFSQCNNPAVKKINRSKFTALEEGMGFINVRECGFVSSSLSSVYNLILSCSGADKKWAGVTFTSLGELGEWKNIKGADGIGEKFTSITTSSITSPIIEIQRQQEDKVAENYIVEWDDENEEEETEYKSPTYTDLMTGAICKKEVEEEPMELFGPGCFNTHTSTTFFPFFRPGFIIRLLDTLEDKKNSVYLAERNWIETWDTEENIKDFLASSIKFLDLNYVNRSSLNIKLEKSES